MWYCICCGFFGCLCVSIPGFSSHKLATAGITVQRQPHSSCKTAPFINEFVLQPSKTKWGITWPPNVQGAIPD